MSCFIFTEDHREGHLTRIVKIYNKVLDLLQSESVRKPISMSTNELFSPSVWISSELREACDDGLTRFEIAYKAPDMEAE